MFPIKEQLAKANCSTPRGLEKDYCICSIDGIL